MNELHERIQKTKSLLAQISINLKKKFIGIDSIIDDILQNITVWLAMPELVGRPVIINLWGLTGVGKTDLVRNLVKELGMGDRFVEIQMKNKSDNETSIQSVLSHSSIEPDSQGILLLDEIQRYRTVAKDGLDVLDQDYQDIWMLLSDGRFSGASRAKSDILDMLFSDIYYDQFYEKDEPKTKKQKKEAEAEAKKEKRRKYKSSLYSAKYLKRVLRLTESVDEIMQWDSHKKFEMLQSALADPSTFEGESYQQLLIFVSGNIDEAYSMSNRTEDADIDADVFHQFSSKINFITIKKSLKKRFKPEQIARLGNTHIIYPSLSKQSYSDIIDLKIDDLLLKIKGHGIDVDIEQSVKDTIYRNGVFPAQGVRPVLSTINAMLGNAIPDFMFSAIEENVTEFTIKCTKSHLTAKIGEKTFRKPIEGAIDKIKAEHDDQERMVTAVHESGHAIVYADLLKTSPVQIVANATTDESGWIGLHALGQSKLDISNIITVLMSGLAAEELVFGDNNRTSGCESDILVATGYAASAIRRWAMNGRVSRIVNKHFQDNANANFNVEDSNDEIEEMIKKAKTQALKILRKYRPFFTELTDALYDKKIITPEKFQRMAKKYKLILQTQPPKKTLYADYTGGWTKFRKKAVAK